MTAHSIIAAQDGPVTLDLSLSAGRITVTVETDRTRAEAWLVTADEDGPSADAVLDARLTADGFRLTVDVPDVPGGSTTVVQSGGSVHVTQSATVVRGSMTGLVIGGGDVFVNGQRVTGNSGIVVARGGSPIHLHVKVPVGSSVSARTRSADVVTAGLLASVSARTTSGDVQVDAATTVRANTMSGDVTIESLTGPGLVNTMSGDIRAHGSESAELSASSMSGDIRTTGSVRVDASSMSGRVRRSGGRS